jgi:hypothetical protein
MAKEWIDCDSCGVPVYIDLDHETTIVLCGKCAKSNDPEQDETMPVQG